MRNPKLLSLLRQGCTVIFPSGYILERDEDNDLICNKIMTETFEWTGDGYRSLTENGLELALVDEENYFESKIESEQLTLQERKEEME